MMGSATLGKSRTNRRGLTREQQLLKEIQSLKRQLSALRKELARVDLDRYDTVKEIIEEHYNDRKNEGQEILDKMKDEWKCKEPECGGFLEIFTYNKLNETWYYRTCSNNPKCKNRTKAKKYTQNVKGIVKTPKE